MCNLIPCFNGERRERDKDIKGIKERKKEYGGLIYESIPVEFQRHFPLLNTNV
jgi:hypothetical protein